METGHGLFHGSSPSAPGERSAVSSPANVNALNGANAVNAAARKGADGGFLENVNPGFLFTGLIHWGKSRFHSISWYHRQWLVVVCEEKLWLSGLSELWLLCFRKWLLPQEWTIATRPKWWMIQPDPQIWRENSRELPMSSVSSDSHHGSQFSGPWHFHTKCTESIKTDLLLNLSLFRPGGGPKKRNPEAPIGAEKLCFFGGSMKRSMGVS